jgi:hypothetical protein
MATLALFLVSHDFGHKNDTVHYRNEGCSCRRDVGRTAVALRHPQKSRSAVIGIACASAEVLSRRDRRRLGVRQEGPFLSKPE